MAEETPIRIRYTGPVTIDGLPGLRFTQGDETFFCFKKQRIQEPMCTVLAWNVITLERTNIRPTTLGFQELFSQFEQMPPRFVPLIYSGEAPRRR